MAPPIIALYDANVLYSAPLRDLLIRIAQTGLVRARWTEAIHDEWIRNLLQNKPDISPVRLARTRDLMNAAVRDCLVTRYDHLIESLALPDPDDRHVLAAAIGAGAEVIVTFNLQDFPANIVSSYGIEAIHPEDFLMSLLELAPETICLAVRKQRTALRNPPLTAGEMLNILEKQGLIQTVGWLREWASLL